MALWKALKGYDESFISKKSDKKSKFTTYLYRGVQLECKTAVKFVLKGRKPEALIYDGIGQESERLASIEIMDEMSISKYEDILEDLFFKGFTISELSKRMGVSNQAVSDRRKIALNQLRSRLKSV